MFLIVTGIIEKQIFIHSLTKNWRLQMVEREMVSPDVMLDVDRFNSVTIFRRDSSHWRPKTP